VLTVIVFQNRRKSDIPLYKLMLLFINLCAAFSSSPFNLQIPYALSLSLCIFTATPAYWIFHLCCCRLYCLEDKLIFFIVKACCYLIEIKWSDHPLVCAPSLLVDFTPQQLFNFFLICVCFPSLIGPAWIPHVG
jgi:hypothetical protein